MSPSPPARFEPKYSVVPSQESEGRVSEEAVVLIDRMGLARRVTVTVCASGEVGARNAVDTCP